MGLSCFTSKTLQKSTIKSRHEQRFCPVGVRAKVLWSVWEEGFRSMDRMLLREQFWVPHCSSQASWNMFPPFALGRQRCVLLTTVSQRAQWCMWVLGFGVQGNRSSSSFFMNPKMAKNNAHYRKPGVSCKCKTLHLQQPRPVSYCRVRQTRDMGADFHWSVHTDLYTLVYLIPFSW